MHNNSPWRPLWCRFLGLITLILALILITLTLTLITLALTLTLTLTLTHLGGLCDVASDDKRAASWSGVVISQILEGRGMTE